MWKTQQRYAILSESTARYCRLGIGMSLLSVLQVVMLTFLHAMLGGG